MTKVQKQKAELTRHDLSELARQGWREFMSLADETKHPVRKRRLLNAVQQAMELADGEKEWAQRELDRFVEWLKHPRSWSFTTALAYEKQRGGSKGVRGNPYYWGIRFQVRDGKIVKEIDSFYHEGARVGD